MNTVYVLGAGTSKGAGLPLMSDFLECAKKLQEKQQDKFDDVWKYIENHKLEKSNIEEILGYLDMKIILNESNSDMDVKRRFLEFIQKTIALSYFYGDAKEISNYFTKLKKFVNRLTEDDTIISFNYDPLIDDCLNKNEVSPDYGIAFKNKEKSDANKRISLFKLHGALNWGICPECKEPIWYDYGYLLERESTNKLQNEMHENFAVLPFNICEKNKNHKRYNIQEETLIVPPSWNKNNYRCLEKLWKEASIELKNSHKIIFIGYSFPQTDIYFKYLLRSSLPKNISVEVVDPNIQNTAGRYLEIFKHSISFKEMTFEEYILEQTSRTA